MSETDLFNILKYKRYASAGLLVYDEWIPAGSTYWINDAGELHKEDGPAVEEKDGSKTWCFNGLKHRENGPAREWVHGYKVWWTNGKFIRDNQK